jgi:hypothetical protein
MRQHALRVFIAPPIGNQNQVSFRHYNGDRLQFHCLTDITVSVSESGSQSAFETGWKEYISGVRYFAIAIPIPTPVSMGKILARRQAKSATIAQSATVQSVTHRSSNYLRETKASTIFS